MNGSIISDSAPSQRSAETDVVSQYASPRALVFDMTRRSDQTATGEIKSNIFMDWPEESYLQVYSLRDGVGLDRYPSRQNISVAISEFSPNLILYRPVPDTPALHALAMQTIRENPYIPVVIWIMDDWPARLQVDDPAQFDVLNADWLWLLERASLRLSICDKMSEAFLERYGTSFTAFANGVDPSDWPMPEEPAADRDLVVRYAGALADNMTANSVHRIACAVDQLADAGLRVRMEIRTRPLWRDAQRSKYANLRHTKFLTQQLSSEEYRHWLSDAGILAIGYNFDKKSLRYIGLSMANKMPECLASGVPVIAHGPRSAATIDYLSRNDCALVVDTPDLETLKKALLSLLEDAELRKRLGKRGREVAFHKHDLKDIRERFTMAINSVVANANDGPSARLASVEYTRDDHVAIDETEVVSLILSDRTGRDHVMLDVGAHFGTSAAYFDKLGWTIHCFEPDPSNRAKLNKSFGSHTNVTIDTRAVSDVPARGVSFFKSEESTGISGLHAFRDTHRESGRVDVTTVSEIVDAHALSKVDFLKIDVEGFDFNVLKGVPWGRLQPDVIECEFEDNKTVPLGHTYHEVAQYLVDKGYAVYLSEWHPIIRYGIQHEWRRVIAFPSPRLADDAWGNILAFREDPGLAALEAAFQSLIVTRSQPLGSTRPKEQQMNNNNEPAARTASFKQPASFRRRIAGWAKSRNRVIYRAGQFVMWTLRQVRHRPALATLVVIIIVGLAGGAIAAPIPVMRVVLTGLLAGFVLLLAVAAVSAFVLRKFMRWRWNVDLRMAHLDRQIVREAQSRSKALNSISAELKIGIARADVAAGEIRIRLEDAMSRMDEADNARQTQDKNLQAKFTNQAKKFRAELAKQDGERQAEIANEIEKLQGEFSMLLNNLQTRYVKLQGEFARAQTRSMSLDIISALRAMGPLIVPGSTAATQAHDDDETAEHGHAVLMGVLAQEAREEPGWFAGKTLIEIGTTRERDPFQGSTEKLAIFATIAGLDFISVDMDPQNAGRLAGVLPYLHSTARAVTAKGEDFLAEYKGSLDVVYLDAFDYDHGKHSGERQSRYREMLKTDITDEACWKMHEDCAKTLVARMAKGGIVAVDDTWTDDSGNYDGKGRLAVPLLLANGFEIVARTKMTIALKRTSNSPADS